MIKKMRSAVILLRRHGRIPRVPYCRYYATTLGVSVNVYIIYYYIIMVFLNS